ncbi:TMEM175 family protein [Geodermatophilus sp. CPCC 206100]|uniref:TMEM175 family protein n=1 Tax=Geodermatophilus sp. CPCC 206100 TaxID=3020054 RepID=UPI003B00021B
MRTERGLDRLVTFLDAVVAIAITLLVLPLVEVLADVAPADDLAEVLRADAAQFGAFLLSFAVIARLWLVHHRLVEQVGAYDHAFVLVNFAWLLTIVVLPFATQVVAVYGAARPAVGLYIGTMAASSALLTALTLLIRRRPALQRPGTPPVDPRAGLVTTGTFVLALLLGVLVPGVNYYALFLLFLTPPLERRLFPRPAGGRG